MSKDTMRISNLESKSAILTHFLKKPRSRWIAFDTIPICEKLVEEGVLKSIGHAGPGVERAYVLNV